MEYNLPQSTLRRAINDTLSAQKTVCFMWVDEGVLAGAGVAWLSTIAPSGATVIEIIVRSVLGGLGGLIIAVLAIFCWNIFQAPYKQRNELRNILKSQQKPSDSEITGTIQLLQGETLILKNDNGVKCTYSFSQVFLSIADELSIGISMNSLENKIIEGLQLNRSEAWYFPHKDKGITHFGLIYLTQ